MRNSRVIAHIGFHKTATSAIQEFCADHRERLLAHGVSYPQSLGGLHGHQELAWVLMSAQPDWADRHYVRDQVLDHYAAALAAAGERTLVISSEDLCCESEVVAPRLRATFPSAPMTIVAYVRDPFDFLLSRYLHEVQYAEHRPFITFVRDELGTADFAWRLRAWTEVFGTENVIVRPYAADSLKHGICGDFLQAIGIGNVALRPTDRVVNPGVPAAFGDLFAYINAAQLEDDSRRRIKDGLLGCLNSASLPAVPRQRAFHVAQLADPERDFLDRCRLSLEQQFGIRV